MRSNNSGGRSAQIRTALPDLALSEVHYSNNVLRISVVNQGDLASNEVVLFVEIDSLALELYNNSNDPFALDAGEQSEVSIHLSDYDSFLRNRMKYLINIYLDPNGILTEDNESNNERISFEAIYVRTTTSEGLNAGSIYTIGIIIGSVSAVSVASISIYYFSRVKKKDSVRLRRKKKFLSALDVFGT
ncbi:MAG: hypothetical protein JW891_09935 [Candidatus Lokiarchaeota archaeon]|nr:hypothetical protein [Candidatus Lokiarchaeota archaeon]